jgi:hypothetical protein
VSLPNQHTEELEHCPGCACRGRNELPCKPCVNLRSIFTGIPVDVEPDWMFKFDVQDQDDGSFTPSNPPPSPAQANPQALPDSD